MYKYYRSALCQISIHCSLKEGAILNLPRENRICPCCNCGDIEDENKITKSNSANLLYFIDHGPHFQIDTGT